MQKIQYLKKYFEGEDLVLASLGFHIPILLFQDESNGREKKCIAILIKNHLTYRISILSRVNKIVLKTTNTVFAHYGHRKNDFIAKTM